MNITAFSELKENWGSYNEKEITPQSIITAHKVLDTLVNSVDLQTVEVFPMRNGGVQIDIGEFKEIEILNYSVTEIKFDADYNIINKNIYDVLI